MDINTWWYFVQLVAILTYLAGLAVYIRYAFSPLARNNYQNPFKRGFDLVLFPCTIIFAMIKLGKSHMTLNPVVRGEFGLDPTKFYTFTLSGKRYVHTALTVGPVNEHSRPSFWPTRIADDCVFKPSGVIMTPATPIGIGNTSDQTHNQPPHIVDAIMTPSGNGAIQVNARGDVLSTGDAPKFASLRGSPYWELMGITWKRLSAKELQNPLPVRQLAGEHYGTQWNFYFPAEAYLN